MNIFKNWLKADRSLDSNTASVKWWDWLFFGFFAIVCYIFFAHTDITITGQHSLEYLKGNISDFYSACKEINGTYSANYMPSTFLVFAAWNWPIAAAGAIPEVWGASSLWMIYWYKLLPILVYFASGYLIFRLTKDCFNFSFNKAKLTSYLFLTAPMAFFSQFMFVQYDIFTVFFMLLGLYFYFNPKGRPKDHYLFILYFAIALTFKYYSLLIFAVLLVLRYKNLGKILLSCFFVAIPFLLEYIIYHFADGVSFQNAVWGFTALDFVKAGGISLGNTSIQLMPFAMLLIIVCAYFMKAKDQRELICKAIFLCCGICFALFALMAWYPQWLLFAIPFWVISVMINKNADVFLWFDIIIFAVFLLLVANVFRNTVDQTLFSNGIFKPLLDYTIYADNLTLSEIYRYNDINMLNTIFSALLCVSFIFKAPRFCMGDIAQELTLGSRVAKLGKPMLVVRLRFLIPVLMFIVPAFVTLPTLLAQPKLLWSTPIEYDTEYVTSEPLEAGTEVIQYFAVNAYEIETLQIATKIKSYDEDFLDTVKLSAEIVDPDTSEVIAFRRIYGSKVKNVAFSTFEFKVPAQIIPNKRYALILKTMASRDTLEKPYFEIPHISVLYSETPDIYQPLAKNHVYADDDLYINGERIPNAALAMNVIGR